MDDTKKIEEAQVLWEEQAKKSPELRSKFTTISGLPVKTLYIPKDIAEIDYLKDLGFPGQYPYTRGIHANMYRGRLWTMREFAGFGTAKETNKRFHYLLSQGETGLSVAFDVPTIMGYDSDHPRSKGEAGRCGVAIDTLADMEALFDGIPLDKITTSMTINSPATILLAMYLAVAEKRGIPFDKLGGTTQNDILKEYIAQKTYIFQPQGSLRLVTDIIAYCTEHVPKWNTISISGYHIREAGSTAVQELAFTLADGFTYVDAALARGLKIDDFAPRLSFFFNSHSDFFEEIAKFRAARRIWAKKMKEKYWARKEESMRLRFHTQTAGCSLTAQQPENNIVRVALQALQAVLGGTQSLHTDSMDETYALPSEKAVLIALRTQQIIAHETGVTNTVDPLAGSYFVENLTNKLEEEAENYFSEIEQRGGMLKCIETGYIQKEIAEASRRFQEEVEKKERIIVGVNEYVEEGEAGKPAIPILEIDPRIEKEQIENIKAVKAKRDNKKIEKSLKVLEEVSRTDENVMPYVLDCVKNYASLGEIVNVWRKVFGEYKEPIIF
ncbi:MAG TPA: acyl-CoA mutase large subunit family protein [Candidatus Brocadiia bacterium]|nr:methylmalonyl-CoA mutase family protein [Candidatus Brocadiales bacterium]